MEGKLVDDGRLLVLVRIVHYCLTPQPGDRCEGGGGETHHHVAHRHVHHEQRHARVQGRVPGHRREGNYFSESQLIMITSGADSW